MQARKGGAWRVTTSGIVYANGAWRSLVNGVCFKGAAWRSVCNFTAAATPPTPPPTPPPTGTMTLAVSPTSSFSTSTSSTVVSGSITATPSGGAAPYTYLWSLVTSDGSAFGINAPTLASTTVRVTGLAPGDSAACSVHCACKDNTGLTATSATVPVSFLCTSSGIIP